ncbi:MAG TPA: sigma-70 family RNA polymerase sigma factor [Planctomycetota bacterium]|jgi:RNA polymerase sigma-70 factor (ECF subfamily)
MSLSSSNPTDEELMTAFARSGDNLLFEQIVARHMDRALHAAQMLLGNRAAAEDAVQECFLRVIRARTSYQKDQSFSSWFFTILRNLCRDERARRATASRHSSSAERDPAPDAAVHAEAREEYLDAQRALQELPAEDREILILRIHAGWCFEEIAAKFDLSTDAAKKRAYRALAQVRQRLKTAETKGKI